MTKIHRQTLPPTFTGIVSLSGFLELFVLFQYIETTS